MRSHFPVQGSKGKKPAFVISSPLVTILFVLIVNITFAGAAAWDPATKILSGNVSFSHTNTFDLYEAQEIFIFWSDAAAGLNNTSEGFFAPITVGGTTYSNPPNGLNFFTRFGLYCYRWLRQTSNTTLPLNSVSFANGNLGLAVGGTFLFRVRDRTTDAGTTS